MDCVTCWLWRVCRNTLTTSDGQCREEEWTALRRLRLWCRISSVEKLLLKRDALHLTGSWNCSRILFSSSTMLLSKQDQWLSLSLIQCLNAVRSVCWKTWLTKKTSLSSPKPTWTKWRSLSTTADKALLKAKAVRTQAPSCSPLTTRSRNSQMTSKRMKTRTMKTGTVTLTMSSHSQCQPTSPWTHKSLSAPKATSWLSQLPTQDSSRLEAVKIAVRTIQESTFLPSNSSSKSNRISRSQWA